MEKENNTGIGINDFERIFKEHFTPLVYFSLNIVKDKEAAKDIVHDSFSVLWEKRSEIASDGNIKSYLFTTVYRKSLNHLRFNKKFTNTDTLEFHSDENTAPDSSVENAELKKKIMKAISLLPEKTREVFVLSRFKNLKYAEIAEKLGISVKTVEAQMSRALRMLRDNLKGIRDLMIFLLFFLFKQ